jgi:hypothetical protein
MADWDEIPRCLLFAFLPVAIGLKDTISPLRGRAPLPGYLKLGEPGRSVGTVEGVVYLLLRDGPEIFRCESARMRGSRDVVEQRMGRSIPD